MGRASDPATIAEARRLADRGTAGALAGLGVLAALGAVAGWTATAELLGPAEAPVHGAGALIEIAGDRPVVDRRCAVHDTMQATVPDGGA